MQGGRGRGRERKGDNSRVWQGRGIRDEGRVVVRGNEDGMDEGRLKAFTCSVKST